MEKRGKMRNFDWTARRKVALESLIQARGNVRRAAELAKKSSPSVSYGYIQELKYAAKYKPFREEYQRRTGELLNALEVNTRYVIQGYVDLTRPDIPASARRQALRDLGQYLGLWDPKTKESGEGEALKKRIEKAIQDEVDPNRKKAIIQALETIADILH